MMMILGGIFLFPLKVMMILSGIFFISLIAVCLIFYLLHIASAWPETYRYHKSNGISANIFDEMLENECKGLRETTYIRRTPNDIAGNWVSLDYEISIEGVEGHVHQNLYQEDGSLGSYHPVKIEFYITEANENDGLSYKLSYHFFNSTNDLYMDDFTKGGTDTEKIENGYYHFLNGALIDSWLKTGKSQFTRDDLGEFKIISDIPYAYAGLPESIPIEEVTVKEAGEDVAYTVWLDNGELLCVQQGNRFRTQDRKSGEVCSLEDILFLNDDFYHWLKTSGQATGNLERIPGSREAGMANTRKMLQKCPVEEIQKMLPGCEFYLEPGYLHIRFPYWKWESSNPCWELNGDELWRGWLNIRTEDIKEYLQVKVW